MDHIIRQLSSANVSLSRHDLLLVIDWLRAVPQTHCLTRVEVVDGSILSFMGEQLCPNMQIYIDIAADGAVTVCRVRNGMPRSSQHFTLLTLSDVWGWFQDDVLVLF